MTDVGYPIPREGDRIREIAELREQHPAPDSIAGKRLAELEAEQRKAEAEFFCAVLEWVGRKK